ncbi:MAG TPA: hypothetical protein VGO93_25375, partial [Candidatus Xenobia bacterium]
VTVPEMMRAVAHAHPCYKGQKTVIFWSKRGSEAILCHTYRDGDKSRYDYPASPRHTGRIVLENADSIRYYEPSKKMLITEALPPSEDLNLLEISFKNYDWDVEGDAIVSGHHTKILKAVNKTTGTAAERLWIDSRHNVILRKESYNQRGEIYFASYFTDIDYLQSLDPALFTLNMPSDAKEVIRAIPLRITNDDQLAALQLQLGFKPVIRDTLSSGYQLLTTRREVLNGHQAARMTYSDGLDVVSLVEMPATVHEKKGNSTSNLVRLGRTLQFEALLEGNLLQWRDHNIFFTLVGSLPQEEMEGMYTDIMNGQTAVAEASPSPAAVQSHGIMYFFWRGIERLSHL